MTLREKWLSARPAGSHLHAQALRTGTGEESLPPGPAPVISTALFLKVLMTVPSFRRRRGLLLRSATFCFSLERTFRLGSEAGEKAARAQTHPHKRAHTTAPPSSSQEPCSGRPGWALTCFAEGEVIAAVIGPEQRQFVGGRRPRGATLGRGTLVQRSMVGSPRGQRQTSGITCHLAAYVYEYPLCAATEKGILMREARETRSGNS